MTDPALDARYGRRRPRSRGVRWTAIGLAAGLVLAFGIWFAAGSLSGSTLEANDLGHRVNDQYSVTVNFEISVPPGSATSCALQAQNEQHGIIGWKIVDIPASNLFTRTFTHTMRTAERAFTGLIYRCWLT
ncbi:MAG: DUF4307 domain-containing protein [Terrimesophilobacter sp.]